MIFVILLIVIIGLYFILNKTSLKKYNENNILFCIIVFILFTTIQGLRGLNVGTDTSKYANLYEKLRTSTWLDIIFKVNVNFEVGFGLLNKVMLTLNLSYRMFFIVVACIINGGLIYFVYKNSKNPLLSIIIFMGIEFFNLSFTALRQMIAVVIILNTYTFIKEEKYIKSIVLIILAAFFHTTALIFLPVVLFKKVKLNKKTYIILSAILIAIQIIGLTLLDVLVGNTYYGQYLHAGPIGEGIKQFVVILIYTIAGIVLSYYNKNVEDNKILILIMITAVLIQSLTWKVQLIGRLMWYFYIFNIIYLPNIIDEVKNIKLKNGLTLTVGALNIAQYLLFSIYMYNVEPYHFIN